MGNSSSVSFVDRELAAAAEKGNMTRVRVVVEKDNANVNYQDEYGWTPLLHAVAEGHKDVVKYLVSKGASLTATTSDKATALHLAVSSQNESVLSLLLQYGNIDVNATNEGGSTALHLACLSDQHSATKALLAFKADPSRCNNEGKTPADVTTSPSMRSLLNGGQPQQGDDQYENKGMQKSLQRLQSLQKAPSVKEVKGYTFLSDDHEHDHNSLTDSSEELTAMSAIPLDNTNNSNNYDYNASSSSSSSKSNGNAATGSRKGKEKAPDDSLLEREFEEILDSIRVLRCIEPENLNMLQVQELIDFHTYEMNKYIEAKRLLEEIRARELELLMNN